MQVEVSLAHRPLQARRHPALNPAPREREQEHEGRHIGQHPRRDQKRTRHQDRGGIHERTTGNPPPTQLHLNARQRPHSFPAHQGRSQQACRRHDSDRRPDPYPAPDLDEQGELDEGNGDEKAAEAREQEWRPWDRSRGCGVAPHAQDGRFMAGSSGPQGHLPDPYVLDVSIPKQGATGMSTPQTYFRRGFGLKAEVRPVIEAEYHSALVDRIRNQGYRRTFGDITVRLAEEFGFCYGVDRAVDYAYETRSKFPDRKVYLVGEIIHNPHVNRRMDEMGIEFIYPDDDGNFDFSDVTARDVVLLPAFGVTIEAFNDLERIGCVRVDTTCGSVFLVWKRVEGYARDGFTAIIHGKYTHEESRATASQVRKHPQGKYLIVRSMAEAEMVCDYITGAPGRLSAEAFMDHFAKKSSDGFDPDRDLLRFGVANQTTMLANESLAIGDRLEAAMIEAHGEDYATENFRSFGTICSATQERQDAVKEMMVEPPDIMIVIGGYNSSNTNHLAHMCRQYTKTFHIEDSECIDETTGRIRHKPELAVEAPEVVEENWIPEGPFELGITAGASTPNNKVGDALVRVLRLRGIEDPVGRVEPLPMAGT
jgi:4-hydroxy-3-methylbut-2-en-1-yl diphosphate reductase